MRETWIGNAAGFRKHRKTYANYVSTAFTNNCRIGRKR